MSKYIELREVVGRGMAVFAKEDLLPGQLILRDEPLLFVDQTDIEPYIRILKDDHISRMFCTWRKLQSQSKEKQARFLALYGPLEGQANQKYNEGITPAFYDFCRQCEIPQKLVPSFLLTFLRMRSILKYNSFQLGDDDECQIYAVYDTASRFAHSCVPNTNHTFQGTAIELRVLWPVKKGEELTLEYNTNYRSEPTHFRRYRYLLFKEFTCHCPRCDALGDDTRQFNCCDVKCKGFHLVCQPISKEPFDVKKRGEETFSLTDVKYTGVEYVEPYLLPCSECSRAASVDYQAAMFAFEARMPTITEQFECEYEDIKKSGPITFSQWKTFAQKIKAAKFPLRHALSKKFIVLTQRFCGEVMNPECNPFSTPQQKDEGMKWCQQVIKDYVTHFETIGKKIPDSSMAKVYGIAGSMVEMLDIEAAMKLTQKCVRMGAIASGKNDTKQKEYEDFLSGQMDRVLRGISIAYYKKKMTLRLGGLIGECLFCGQSAEGTSFTLMQCSTCKDAEYCSRECQKLHWKFHKLSCGKMPNAQWAAV